MKKIKYVIYSIFVVIILAGCSVSLAADVTPPPNLVQPQPPISQPTSIPVVLPMIQPDIQNGAQIYDEKCAACHGETGMGDGVQSSQLPNPVTPIGDFSIARISKPIDWYHIITIGNFEKFMPGFQSLNDRERWDVTSYVLTLSLSEDLIKVGEIVFDENCAECHTNEKLPLENASKMADFSISDIQDIVDLGINPDMPGFSDSLSSEENLAVSIYVRYLGFNSGTREVIDSESTQSQQVIEEEQEPANSDATTFNIIGEIQNIEEIPTNLEVSLAGYDGMDPVLQLTTNIKEDGSYQFVELEKVSGRVYQTSLVIDGIQHTSEVVHDPIIDNSGNFELPIVLRKISTDNSALYAERMHVFFDFLAEDSVQVVEMFVIENPTDAVIVPADSLTPVIEFKLPPESQNLQFEQGMIGVDYIELSDGFGVMDSFNANSSVQVLFAYELPYSKSLDLDIHLPLPVNASIFMIPSDLVKFSSNQLAFSGERDVQGMRIQTYTSGALISDSSININLSGKIKQNTQLIQNSNSISIIIGSLGLVLALGFAFYFIRKKNTSGTESDSLPLEEDVESLLDAVIALDDAFQSGEIPEDAYQNRRKELTEQIKRIQNPEE
ncbi:MAG TPA: c-type cytochrome [Anaerolineaceae bacterium]|nr:c-type cytochrome [Anaerolineaceae bacterium]